MATPPDATSTSATEKVTPDRFRALARSSPWRWETLRFVTSWPIQDRASERAWLRRPDLLRVERLDGSEPRVIHADPPTRGVLFLGREGGGRTPPQPEVRRGRDLTPRYHADGLVEERPSGPLVDYDDPMNNTYHWVAMLDPVELADGGIHGETGDHARHGTELADLRLVDHHGRPAWEAVVVPTGGYEPRCSCCALLFSPETDLLIVDEGGGSLLDGRPSDFRFPEAHRVRLDRGTGVCVLTEQIGGSTPGIFHEVVIEAVDDPMPDELFVRPRKRRWRR